MGRNPKQERQQAHALLDMLPDEKLNAVRSLLEVMIEPLSRSLALAAVEEEVARVLPLATSDDERSKLAREVTKMRNAYQYPNDENNVESRLRQHPDTGDSLARGEGIPHEEILREFGLKK